MEEATAFTFDELEHEILAKALAMYAGYAREMEAKMLVGDESDAGKITRRASRAEGLARYWFERQRDERWEEASAEFQNRVGRPMDINDVSDYDWFEHSRNL